jgi:hypothetical protein
MENHIVDVEFEDGSVCICQVKGETENGYLISELVYTGSGNYEFSTEFQIIEKESVSGFYDVTDLEDTGLYIRIRDGVYEQVDSSDEDYEASTEDEESSESDISLDDEE